MIAYLPEKVLNDLLTFKSDFRLKSETMRKYEAEHFANKTNKNYLYYKTSAERKILKARKLKSNTTFSQRIKL